MASDEIGNRFVYGPASFRLISFDAATQTDDERAEAEVDILSIRLQAFTSHPLPKYIALSYTWGSSTRASRIRCNGKVLLVTQNLLTLLKQCRSIAKESSNTDTVYFWADGVCINQDDVSERNWAVAGMASIYQNAGDVIMYIGQPKDASQADLAIEIVETNVRMGNTPVQPDTLDAAVRSALQDRTNPVWKAVETCLNPSTFIRAWVIQEAILAEKLTIRYGSASCAFDTYRDFMNMTLGNAGLPRTLDVQETVAWRSNLMLIEWVYHHRRKRKEGQQFALLEMLDFARYASASDLRDKIYAVLNMSSETVSMIDVDYSVSNSVSNTYTAFAYQKLLTGRPMGFAHETLYYAGLPNNVPDLPSWVPDWSAVQHHTLMPYKLYHYDDKQESTFEIQLKSTTAQVQGRIVDTILFKSVCCGGMLNQGDIPMIRNEPYSSNLAIFAARLHEITHNFVTQRLQEYPSGEDLEDVIRRTLTLDLSHIAYERIKPEDNTYKEAYQAFCEEPRSYLSQLDSLSSDADRWELDTKITSYMNSQKPKWWPIVRTISLFQAGRCMCITKNGYLACLPNAVEVGDNIVMFQGAQTPFILRSSKQNRHLFVGYGYVHGIMDGIPRSELEKYPSQTFILE